MNGLTQSIIINKKRKEKKLQEIGELFKNNIN
jgi:hypothetical protein